MKKSTMDKIADLVLSSSERMVKIGEKIKNNVYDQADIEEAAKETGYVQAIYDVMKIIQIEQEIVK